MGTLSLVMGLVLSVLLTAILKMDGVEKVILMLIRFLQMLIMVIIHYNFPIHPALMLEQLTLMMMVQMILIT